MRLCTRCDTDESVGIHLVIRKRGKEVAHFCKKPGEGGMEIEPGAFGFGITIREPITQSALLMDIL